MDPETPSRSRAARGLATLAAWMLLSGVAAHRAAGQPPGASAGGPLGADARIVFLHHSTGECIWNGGVSAWFDAHNAKHGTRYRIAERNFPKDSPYGWENHPYDYWNIWVNHAGAKPYKEEPTLEMLTRDYDVIIFKHCFPVSNIEADTGQPDVASSDKRIENYKLQYAALKQKMNQFPQTRFILWTGAAQVAGEIDEASARRAKAFFDWVRSDWDRRGDNIYLWDFYALETEGGLYLKPAYAQARSDSHPNEAFSRAVAPCFCRRIVDVIAGRGDTGDVTGKGVPGTSAGPPAGEAISTQPGSQTPPAPPPASAPAETSAVQPAGPERWCFDDAEDAAGQTALWGKGAKYAKDDGGNVVRIGFAGGDEEDWGEYGKHMVVRSRPMAHSRDISGFRYLALRSKADREMTVLLGLVTLPDPAGDLHQSHFSFTAYLRAVAGPWKWVVFDLTRLELAAEGESAYEKAGKPSRPLLLTYLKLSVNKKHDEAQFSIDDILFVRDLPDSLRPHLRAE